MSLRVFPLLKPSNSCDLCGQQPVSQRLVNEGTGVGGRWGGRGGEDLGFPSHLRSRGPRLTWFLKEGVGVHCSPGCRARGPRGMRPERVAPHTPSSGPAATQCTVSVQDPAALQGARRSRCGFRGREPRDPSGVSRGRAPQGSARGRAREPAPDGARAPGDAGAPKPEWRLRGTGKPPRGRGPPGAGGAPGPAKLLPGEQGSNFRFPI